MREVNCSPSESTALTVVEPQAGARRPFRPIGPQAAFLAQMIASARHVPQFCDKRRADPFEAEAAYRDVIARLAAP